MKKLKKLFAAMVAMVMAFAMGVTVYAADITIMNWCKHPSVQHTDC